MANTRDIMGDAACLDALVADTLVTFEDSDVKKVGVYSLCYKKSLTELKLSSCTNIGDSGIRGCPNITTVDMLGGGRLGPYSCNACTSLSALILRSNTITTTSDSALESTKIRVGDGAVYVPSDLIASYKNAAQWEWFTFLPISAYPASDFSTISDSWDDIIAACGNGTYLDKYAVGDTKSIVIDGTTYYMQLVAKDADVLATDGTTTVPTTWVMYRKAYSTTYVMNSTATSSGGWANSEMRSWLSSTVLPLIPSNVRSAIKEVRKYSSTYENSATVKDGCVTSDKLWILSNREMGYSNSFETLGPTYNGVFKNNATRTKYKQNNGTLNWWLRSANGDLRFLAVATNGSTPSGANANQSGYGVVLGFCI